MWLKSPVYGHLKTDKAKEQKFMEAVNVLIKDSVTGSIAVTVLLDDLKAFNAKHGLRLDPYALGIYCCFIQIRWVYHNHEIDVVFDKFTNSISRAAKAWRYAASDCLQPLHANLFTPIPLQKDESWRDILPLQAADFIAWEVRKFRRERNEMKLPLEVRSNRDLTHLAVVKWEKKHQPRVRESFKAARFATILYPRHTVLDEYNLEAILERHANGWGA